MSKKRWRPHDVTWDGMITAFSASQYITVIIWDDIFIKMYFNGIIIIYIYIYSHNFPIYGMIYIYIWMPGMIIIGKLQLGSGFQWQILWTFAIGCGIACGLRQKYRAP
jgi:hypothetical protein